jgi:hypothetical protein
VYSSTVCFTLMFSGLFYGYYSVFDFIQTQCGRHVPNFVDPVWFQFSLFHFKDRFTYRHELICTNIFESFVLFMAHIIMCKFH